MRWSRTDSPIWRSAYRLTPYGSKVFTPDAGSCSSMERKGTSTCKLCSSHPCQQRTGTSEIYLLPKVCPPLAFIAITPKNFRSPHKEMPNGKLAEMALINLDEFDRYSLVQMPQLKNLMQLSTLNLRKPHQKSYRLLPRIASFIGTSNRMDLLTDPSGSRRYICIEVKQAINLEGIEHSQIYAQLKAELMADRRYFFNKEEEQQIQQHNLSFYRQTLAEEVLRNCFRPAFEEDTYELLSAAEIFQTLQRHNPTAMRGANPNHFSQILATAGVVRKHTKWGNVYRVHRLNNSPQKE